MFPSTSRALFAVLLAAGFTVGCGPGPAERALESSDADAVDLVDRLDRARVQPPPSPAGEEASGESLVLAEGFEGGEEADPGAPWSLQVWDGQASGGVDETVAHGGSRSYRIRAPAGSGMPGADADVALVLPVEGKTRYRFEGFVRTRGLVPIGAEVHGSFFLTELFETAPRGGLLPQHLEMEDLEGDTEGWRRLVSTFTTHQDTVRLRVAGSLANWGKATGTVWFDDVRLWRLPDADLLPPTGGPRAGAWGVDGEIRRSVAVPVPSRLAWPLAAKGPGRLETALGVPGQAGTSEGVLFRVLFLPERGAPRLLLHRVLAPGRPWREVAVVLPADRGPGELVLETTPAAGRGAEPPDGAALWGHPILRPSPAPAEARHGHGPPVVLWISVDTLRADHLGHLGYHRDTTPHLDELARRGATFLQASSPSPWTLPGHVSQLTATFETSHQADDRTGLGEGPATAAEIFHGAGYFTGALTTHLFVSETFGLHRGFDTFRTIQDARAGAVVDRALSWLDRHGAGKALLFLHLFDPHWDYDPPPPWDTWYDPDYEGPLTGTFADSVQPFQDPQVVPDPRDLAHVVALYDGEIRYVDEELGRLLRGVEELGLGDRLRIVVTSDHGEEFREHGSMGHGSDLYEEVLHVPLILAGPEVPEGLRPAAPVRTVDILPTLTDLLGIAWEPPPAGGGSLRPHLLAGGAAGTPPPVFAETHRFGARRYVLRRGGMKLHWDRREGRRLLFDLAEDPGEQRDLSALQTERAERLAAELERLRTLLEETREELAAEPTVPVQLDESQEELLRSLGYVN